MQNCSNTNADKMIYLDYAATTPLDSRILPAMQSCMTMEGVFGNSASSHLFGRSAHELIEAARVQVAASIGGDWQEIIWTSGATESNNLALKGAASLWQRKGKHIITMKTEHKSVLDTCLYLEKIGYRVTYLEPQANGLLDLNQLADAFCSDTILVSIMHVNNETGIAQDIKTIAEIVKEKGALFHVDAAQSFGKLPINVGDTPVDLLSLSAHKIYGPKGIGALFLRRKPRVRVEPLIHGGGHEQGMRSGTLPTHQIVGMGLACEIGSIGWQSEYHRIKCLQQYFMKALEGLPVSFNGSFDANQIPHIINIQFDGMIADALLAEIPHIAASKASACQGQGIEGSYVLRAMGRSADEIQSAVRFSLGRFTTQDDIEKTIESIYRLMKPGQYHVV